MKTINVVAAIIIKEGKIFLARKTKGNNKGLYEFPGGKIERQETPQEALIREIKEELNISVTINASFSTIEYDYPDFHLSMECFYCSTYDDILSSSDHDDLIYVDISNDPLLAPADQIVWERLKERKALFFDIDGTLAIQGVIPQENITALKELKEKYPTFICTGRAPFYAVNLFSDLVNGFICCNGRYIIYQGKTIYKKPLTKEETDYYETTLQKLDCPYFLIGEDHIYVHDIPQNRMEMLRRNYGDRISDKILADSYYAVEAIYRFPEQKDKVTAALKGSLIFNDHRGTGADCSTLNFHKGDGIKEVLSLLAIKEEAAYGFGDGDNDILMFDAVAHKIAMGNGVEALKQKATYITSSHDDHGIINALIHEKLL